MSEPLPLRYMVPAIFLCYVLFLGTIFLAARDYVSDETVAQSKRALGLLTWAWLFHMTSSVAFWKGRRRWPWFLLGILSMWGVFAAMAGLGLLTGLLLPGLEPVERVGLLALFMLLGLPLGYCTTAVVSYQLRLKEPLPGSPEAKRGEAPPPPPAEQAKPAWSD